MDTQQFKPTLLKGSFVNAYLSQFYVLTTVKHSAVISSIQGSVCVPVFNSLGYIYLGLKLLGYMVIFVLIF